MARKKKKKIVSYKKPLKINIGVIMFGVIFIYVCICLVSYLTKENISVYEVVEGSLDQNNIYTGIAIRNEQIVTTDTAGVVNYYVRDGSKAAVGDVIYSLDEAGQLQNIISNENSDNELTEDNLLDLKNKLSNYKISFDSSSFDSVYDFKYNMSNIVLEYINQNMMNSVSSYVNGEEGEQLFHVVTTPESGVILYSYDGKENLSTESISSEDFDKDNYIKTYLKSGSSLLANSTAYKIIKDENWSILIELTPEQVEAFGDDDVVRIRFLKDNVSVACGFSIITNQDSYFGKIDLNKFMINYASERYLEIEVSRDYATGLKIPVSSVTTRDFYIIPKDYASLGGNTLDTSFIKMNTNEDGTTKPELITPTIFKSDENYYYVSTNEIDEGTILMKPESEEMYTISEKASVQGVYCVNKGYSIFRQVEIIDSNNTYYIIKSSTSYGISQYDRIVLYGTKVTDNQIIY